VTSKQVSPEQFLSQLQDGRAHDAAYRLTLYVAGTTPRSARAIVNVRAICEEHLLGRYNLQIVDITNQGKLAMREQIVAVPMLVREQPLPMLRFVGDMSDKARILAGLEFAS
jgi:circadian clock protein KaiB